MKNVLVPRWIGLLLALAGAGLCVFAYLSAGRNRWVAVLTSGAPFLVTGALLFSSRGRPLQVER